MAIPGDAWRWPACTGATIVGTIGLQAPLPVPRRTGIGGAG
jgi:hypothetical protein